MKTPTTNELKQIIADAITDYLDHNFPHLSIEGRFHGESESLQIHVISAHNVDIYSVDVKYSESFSG